MEFKFDGLTVVLYVEGIFVQGAIRRVYRGCDFNLRTIKSIPLRLKEKATLKHEEKCLFKERFYSLK